MLDFYPQRHFHSLECIPFVYVVVEPEGILATASVEPFINLPHADTILVPSIQRLEIYIQHIELAYSTGSLVRSEKIVAGTEKGQIPPMVIYDLFYPAPASI